MIKKIILLALLFICNKKATAQVLFTYGKSPVTLETFSNSFKKNNPDSILSKTAFQDYLNLFINYKLKVKAAYDLKMDTLPNQIADLLAFEEQIKAIHLLDSTTLNALVKEAIDHSLEEVELSHIFIAYQQEKELAKRTIKEIQLRLNNGESFEELATIYSNDTEAKKNKGYLGFIKAFTLPYTFEKVACTLKNGEISSAIESDAGIHIFKRISSNKIAGRISFAQILLTIPNNANNTVIQERALLANTLYKEAVKGAKFDSLVALYSDDRSSNTRGGILAGIETGDFDPVFEQQMRALQEDGQLSPVFRTEFGFHILKRISQEKTTLNLDQLSAEIKELVLQDDRIAIAKKAFIEKAIGKHGLTAEEKNKEVYVAKQLEKFSPGYAAQIHEFKDGNLLFEIMDKKIWSKSSSDLAALKAFHTARRQKYQWKNSVSVVSITTQNKEIAQVIKADLEKQIPLNNIRKLYSEVAFIDSTRQESSEVMGIGKANAKAGFMSEILKNETDDTYTFNLVLKVHKDPSVMEFDEARVQVINDYQKILEEKWINDLKKKYPVIINQAVLNKALSTLH